VKNKQPRIFRCAQDDNGGLRWRLPKVRTSGPEASGTQVFRDKGPHPCGPLKVEGER